MKNTLTIFKVRCIKDDILCLKKGEIYDATYCTDDSRYYGVFDLMKDWYAYPKEWFEIVEEERHNQKSECLIWLWVNPVKMMCYQVQLIII